MSMDNDGLSPIAADVARRAVEHGLVLVIHAAQSCGLRGFVPELAALHARIIGFNSKQAPSP